MSAPRLENDAEVAAEPHVLVDARGERLVLVAKATFLLASGPARGTVLAGPFHVHGAEAAWYQG